MDDRVGVVLMDLKEQFQAQQVRTGGVIPPFPDGPIVPICRPLELAQALEHECNRAASVGHTKIRLDMDLYDAAELSQLLRRAAILGA